MSEQLEQELLGYLEREIEEYMRSKPHIYSDTLLELKVPDPKGIARKMLDIPMRLIHPCWKKEWVHNVIVNYINEHPNVLLDESEYSVRHVWISALKKFPF